MSGNGTGVAVLIAGLWGITLPLPALFRKVWFPSPIFQRCCPEWTDFHHVVSQLRPDKVLCAVT